MRHLQLLPDIHADRFSFPELVVLDDTVYSPEAYLESVLDPTGLLQLLAVTSATCGAFCLEYIPDTVFGGSAAAFLPRSDAAPETLLLTVDISSPTVPEKSTY